MFIHTFCLYMGGVERVNIRDGMYIKLGDKIGIV